MIHLRPATWLAVLGGLCWVLLLVPAPERLASERAWALPVAGILVQFLIVAALVQSQVGAPVPERRRDSSIAVALTGAALLAGILSGKVEVVTALLLFICGSAVLLLVAAAIDEMRAGRSVELTTHSGGLGGSVGGWKVSPLAVITLLIVILVGAVIALAPDTGAAGDDVSAKTVSNVAVTTKGAEPKAPVGRSEASPAATAPNPPAGSGAATGTSDPQAVPAPAGKAGPAGAAARPGD
jgi:uncharacterized membrane protein